MKQFYLLLLCTAFAIGQQSFPLKGQVVTVNQSPENINIINKTKGNGVVTDFDGNFEIEVQVDDVLVIGSMTVYTQQFPVSEKHIEDGFLTVTLLEKKIELNEIQLTEFKSINAVSMGILSSPAKVYTKSERRLYTASSGGGLIPLDLIINTFSGRLDGLKRSHKADVANKSRQDIMYWFNEAYVLEHYALPELLVDSFYYYASEDIEIAKHIKSKNKVAAEFRLSQIASNYKVDFAEQIIEVRKNN